MSSTYTIVRHGWDELQVHKHKCRDTAKANPSDRWEVEADSLREVVEDTYGPEAGSFYEESGYIPGTPEYDNAWQDYVGEFRVMPCAGPLPTEAVTA